MAIQRLSELVVNQIAAGEVVERPASVVKELVENSLDAGAGRIDVAIEEGGARLIRISDDGAGMAAEELPLAVAPHATSKLEEPQQLEAIGTLGFRGEALASIASVSRMRLTSRARGANGPAEAGAVLEASGDEVSAPAPTAASPGTVTEVRDLFFNTPARRKFLRTAQTEIGHIHDTIGRLAIAQPGVSFTVSHNGRKTMELPGGRGWHQRCVDVLGRELGEALLPFERRDSPEQGGGRVYGLAGTPEIARATGKHQHVCLNGRPIRDRNLSHAIKEAYRGLIPPDRHPVVVAFLELDPAAADVNVHPTKAEVRFRRPSQAHGLLLAGLRQQLLASDLTAGLKVNGQGQRERERPSLSAEAVMRDGSGEAGEAQAEKTEQQAPGGRQQAPDIGQRSGGHGEAALSTDAFVNYFKRMDPKQKGFVYEQVKQALAEEGGAAGPESREDEPADQPPEAPEAPEAEQAAARRGGEGRVPQSPALKAQSVLQVHNSYVVTQDEQGLLIVDQHALHERVMFEQLRQRVLSQGGALESQRLLMPTVLEQPRDRTDTVERLRPLLSWIGIELEPFGERQLAVQAFPSFLFDRGLEPGEFVEELLDKTEAGELALPTRGSGDETEGASGAADGSWLVLEAALQEVLEMMACKAAVKAGDQLSEAELASLLQQREAVERSTACPHGRPTSLRLTLKDLEKQFGRS
jgi:DNA mismatch repair protein MutL